jgi:hypothetical protein
VTIFRSGEFKEGYSSAMGPLVIEQTIDSDKQCAKAKLASGASVAQVRAVLGLSLLELSLMFSQELKDTQTIQVRRRASEQCVHCSCTQRAMQYTYTLAS